MKKHTAKFYINWLSHNGLTLSDMAKYIYQYFGRALERHEVIDYLIWKRVSAPELKYMTSIE